MYFKIIFILTILFSSFNVKAECEFNEQLHILLYESIYGYQEVYEEKESHGLNEESSYLLIWEEEEGLSVDFFIDDGSFFETAEKKVRSLGKKVAAYALMWPSEEIISNGDELISNKIMKINFQILSGKAFEAYFKLDGDPDFKSLVILGCGRSLQ